MFPTRVWFSKTGPARFISHLDLMRFFTRALRRAGLPVWHTEGFNPHPYINFASPLALGLEGLNECFDIKLTEALPARAVLESLAPVMTGGIAVNAVTLPLRKTAELALADYSLYFEDAVKDELTAFLRGETVEIDKKGKLIDVKPDIGAFSVVENENSTALHITLPCSPSKNVSPALVAAAFCARSGAPAPKIVRNRLLAADGSAFA